MSDSEQRIFEHPFSESTRIIEFDGFVLILEDPNINFTNAVAYMLNLLDHETPQ